METKPPQLRNIRLLIEYDGTDFAGWQRQPSSPTIQAHIEDALTRIHGKRMVIYGASRTDSGVSARGQVANFYTDSAIEPERWAVVLNFYLPRTIRILEAREMPMYFHAQKMALSKVYEYRVLNRAVASALDRRVLFYPGELDWTAIRSAIPVFVGEHDFKGFQGAKATVLTTVRRVIRFELHEREPGLYCFEIEGTGFLKQMVRAIIGTLLEVGEGKRTVESITEVFRTGDRNLAGRTVLASGLCLVRVNYPEVPPRGSTGSRTEAP